MAKSKKKQPKPKAADTWRLAKEQPEQFLQLMQTIMEHCPEDAVITLSRTEGISLKHERPEAPKDTYCKFCKTWKTAAEHAHNIIDDMCDDCFRAGIHYGRLSGYGLVPRSPAGY